MVEENKYLRILVGNAQQGRVGTLEELYEINLNQVHTIVNLLAGNKLLAEHLTKIILICAWERIGEHGLREKLFSDWIRELAVHITVDELRNPKLYGSVTCKGNFVNNGRDMTIKYSPSTSSLIALFYWG